MLSISSLERTTSLPVEATIFGLLSSGPCSRVDRVSQRRAPTALPPEAKGHDTHDVRPSRLEAEGSPGPRHRDRFSPWRSAGRLGPCAQRCRVRRLYRSLRERGDDWPSTSDVILRVLPWLNDLPLPRSKPVLTSGGRSRSPAATRSSPVLPRASVVASPPGLLRAERMCSLPISTLPPRSMLPSTWPRTKDDLWRCMSMSAAKPTA